MPGWPALMRADRFPHSGEQERIVQMIEIGGEEAAGDGRIAECRG